MKANSELSMPRSRKDRRQDSSGTPSVVNRLVLSAFMVALMYGGGVMMVGTVRELMESFEAMSWPTVAGKVTRSEIKVTSIKSSGRSSNGIHRSTTSDSYEPLIEYEFELDGQTHKGDRRVAVQSGNAADRKSVEQILKKYPINQAVTVSYKPGDPSQCLLEPGSWGGFFVMAGLSLFLILVPVGVFYIVWGPNKGRCISGL